MYNSLMKEYDFYIVPTPIGNLGDITQRAIEILKSVDIIACEDIRVTQKLLNHFDIKTKCISYHKFNEKERVDYFLKILSEGKKIALVSDAGTPLVPNEASRFLMMLKAPLLESPFEDLSTIDLNALPAVYADLLSSSCCLPAASCAGAAS